MACGIKLTRVSKQFLSLFGNSSVLVKFIGVSVLCGYLLSYSEKVFNLLSFAPSLPFAPWVWTCFTFWFLELHLWEVTVDIITLGVVGNLIEPLWGSLETIIFFVLVNIGSAIVSCMFYVALYICTLNTDVLFSVHIHGLGGYVGGVLVAVKQIMPNYFVKTPLGNITSGNIPLNLFCMLLVLRLSRFLDGTYPIMFVSGLFVSWTYLRFFQRHSNGSNGDVAEHFCFASFFPDLFRPPVSAICNTIHGCLVRFGVGKHVPPKCIYSPLGIIINIPGDDLRVKERRRKIALQALSERLKKVEQLPTTSQPTWEKDKSTASVHHTVTIPMSTDDTSSKPSYISSSSSTPTTSSTPDIIEGNGITEA